MKTRDAKKRVKELVNQYEAVMVNFPNGFSSTNEPEAYQKTSSIRKELESIVYDQRYGVQYYEGVPSRIKIVRKSLRDLVEGFEF